LLSQLLALFNKLVRKMVGALQESRFNAEAESLPDSAAARKAAAHMTPLAGDSLGDELQTAAEAGLARMQDESAQKQAEWLEDGALAQ